MLVVSEKSRQEMNTVTVKLTVDQARHLEYLLVHEVRELQDTTRLTNHDLYATRVAFNHRISNRIRGGLSRAKAELVK